MSLDISACGLTVIPGRERQGWECTLRQVQLAELDLSAALNFTRELIRNECLTAGLPGCSFIAAAFHPGKEDVCPGLEYADQPVNIREEMARNCRVSTYTVCAFYSDTWQTYCGYHEAVSPRMAYYQAFEQEQGDSGRYLYVAGVHRGEVLRHSMPGTDEAPAYGDPACATAEAMADEMNTLLGVG